MPLSRQSAKSTIFACAILSPAQQNINLALKAVSGATLPALSKSSASVCIVCMCLFGGGGVNSMQAHKQTMNYTFCQP